MNLRKLILSNVLVASALFTFLIWMVVDGFNFPNANGQTAKLMAGNVGVEYDSGVFNISDVSIKYDDVWGPTMIGLIENTDPVNTIEGVTLSVQMYDKNNHLIGVMKGYPQSSNIFPNQKTAFEIQSGDEDIRNIDHAFIEILATDWGDSNVPSPTNENVSALGSNSSDPPYIGLVGVSLDPDLSKQLGLNDTKGVLLTNITKDSPAEKSGLRAGSNTTTYNDREINIGGDIIQKIDDREVSYMHDITAYVQSQKNVGDNVTLTVLRDNATKNVDVTLGQKPSLYTFYRNPYFSINIPDNWTYVEGSNTPESKATGFGLRNNVALTPNEFSDFLLTGDFKKFPFAFFEQDTEYRINNAPLESYVRYIIDKLRILNITSQQYTTVGNEKAVRIYANETAYYPNTKVALYLVMHDKQPYLMEYFAKPKNYEKYLPDFEQAVKSFTFEDLSENKNSQELYEECVSVSGKSFCDFLFKR